MWVPWHEAWYAGAVPTLLSPAELLSGHRATTVRPLPLSPPPESSIPTPQLQSQLHPNPS